MCWFSAVLGVVVAIVCFFLGSTWVTSVGTGAAALAQFASASGAPALLLANISALIGAAAAIAVADSQRRGFLTPFVAWAGSTAVLIGVLGGAADDPFNALALLSGR